MGAIKQWEIVGRYAEFGRFRSSMWSHVIHLVVTHSKHPGWDQVVSVRAQHISLRCLDWLAQRRFHRVGVNHFWSRMIDMLDVLGSCQACWLGGYLALCDREDGSPWHIITSEDAIKAASESDHSDGAGMDAVTEHQFSVATAPPHEFTNVRTVSGDKPEGRQPWRSIVGLAGPAERRPPGYRYDK